jgi:hypothetical protein
MAYPGRSDQACSDDHHQHNPVDTVRTVVRQLYLGIQLQGSRVMGCYDSLPSGQLEKHYKRYMMTV